MSARSKKPLLRRARADADVGEAIDFYRLESFAAALGFIDAVEAAFRAIARAPGIGAPRHARTLNIPGLRFWTCRRYPYLIFYVEQADHIEVWRVLHARRDIPAWLGEDA